MIFVLEKPLLFIRLRSAVPIDASWAAVTLHVGYVGFVFSGSFYPAHSSVLLAKIAALSM